MSLNSHRFAAIRGRQSGGEYYTVICEMNLIPKLFLFNEATIPAELRSQRHLNKGRIPEMARYITNNPKNYIFSALTASIDGKVEFKPHKVNGNDSDIGELIISGDAQLMINDGQHRRAAIERALGENPEISKDSIAVVFFKDKGLKKSQQMFSDLNRHAIRPSTSLARLYDHRDPLAEIVRRLVYEAEVFKGVVEMERSNLAERSTKMFPFSGVYSATKYLVMDDYRKKVDQSTKKLIKFWNNVGNQFGKWTGVRTGNISASELRRDYINTHVVILQAIGLSGRDLLKAHPINWQRKLKGLKTINWLKTNPIWDQRVLVNGRVVKNNNSIILASNIIKKSYGLKLTTEEKAVESKLKRGEIYATRRKKK
jgi:DNA sulfur modification protein DndB